MKNKLIFDVLIISAFFPLSAELRSVNFSLSVEFDSLKQMYQSVSIRIPYRELIFLKDSTGSFVSRSSAGITFLDKAKSPIKTYFADSLFSLDNYSATQMDSYLVFNLRYTIDGSYGYINIEFADNNSKNKSIFFSNLLLPLFTEGSSYISEIYPLFGDMWVVKNSKEMPVELNYVLVDSAKYGVNMKILDDKNKVKFKKYFQLSGTGTDTLILSSDLYPGAYTLNAELINSNKLISSMSNSFFVEFSFKYSKREYDDLVNALSYIAKWNEVTRLRNSLPEERESLWVDFWRRQIQNPVLSGYVGYMDFVERYNYSNNNFSGYKKGYKTDFGRIYITYGKPDEIERHPFEIDSKPYEVWYYYSQNYTFTFMDQHGYGEYILVTQQ